MQTNPATVFPKKRCTESSFLWDRRFGLQHRLHLRGKHLLDVSVGGLWQCLFKHQVGSTALPQCVLPQA